MPPQKKNLGPCKQQACNIQSCLADSNYQEQRCLQEIAALIACCDAVVASGEEKPVHCAFNQRYRTLLAKASNQDSKQAGKGGGGTAVRRDEGGPPGCYPSRRCTLHHSLYSIVLLWRVCALAI